MCMSLEVEGKRQWIEFKGLRSQHKGTYTTDDPRIMEALEKRNGYGIEYVVTSTQGEPEKKPNPPAPDTTEESPVTPIVPPVADIQPPVQNPNPSTKVVPGIKSAAKAREYLLENIEDMKMSELSNKEKVLAVAAAHKISFPDLI